MKKNLLILGTLALLASCSKVPLPVQDIGAQLDEEKVDAKPSITFRAVNTTDNVVIINLPEGGDFTSVKVLAQSNKPLELSQTLLLEADESLVEAYSQKTNTVYTALPAPFFKIDNGGTLVFPEGSKESEQKLLRLYATNPLGNVLEAGRYLLPVRVKSTVQQVYDDVLYIDLTIQAPFSGRPELYTGEDFFTVLYLNTSEYDPRLVTDYVVEKYDWQMQLLWSRSVGNIVNIRGLRVEYNTVTRGPELVVSSDLRYLLNHFDTYFRPIQESGRKLCLCLESGYDGLGFSNFKESWIDDIVFQVKSLIQYYGFDGLNLWDKNMNFDGASDDIPDFCTTSYPLFVKKMRESIGDYALLTLTDYESPTEYFWNTEATGGIVVGNYLDYAWSGYYKTGEPVQIIDPWHPECPEVSSLHQRKPIAGLSPKRWGCTMVDRRMSIDFKDAFENWVLNGHKLNDIYVVYDIQTYLQGNLEGVFPIIDVMEYMDSQFYEDSGPIYMMDATNFFDWSIQYGDGSGYNAWKKSW